MSWVAMHYKSEPEVKLKSLCFSLLVLSVVPAWAEAEQQIDSFFPADFAKNGVFSGRSTRVSSANLFERYTVAALSRSRHSNFTGETAAQPAAAQVQSDASPAERDYFQRLYYNAEEPTSDTFDVSDLYPR